MRRRPSHLRQTGFIHLAVRRGRMKIMAAAIGVEAERKPMGTEGFRKAAERRGCAFLLGQKRDAERIWPGEIESAF